MVVCQFYLTDVGDDDGGDTLDIIHFRLPSFSCALAVLGAETSLGVPGLCVVPGSHKANYGMPNNVRLLTSRTAREGIKHIKLNAGDMVMFSESTTSVFRSCCPACYPSSCC